MHYFEVDELTIVLRHLLEISLSLGEKLLFFTWLLGLQPNFVREVHFGFRASMGWISTFPDQFKSLTYLQSKVWTSSIADGLSRLIKIFA